MKVQYALDDMGCNVSQALPHIADSQEPNSADADVDALLARAPHRRVGAC
jgi:hypothetical protein